MAIHVFLSIPPTTCINDQAFVAANYTTTKTTTWWQQRLDNNYNATMPTTWQLDDDDLQLKNDDKRCCHRRHCFQAVSHRHQVVKLLSLWSFSSRHCHQVFVVVVVVKSLLCCQVVVLIIIVIVVVVNLSLLSSCWRHHSRCQVVLVKLLPL